MTVPSGSRKGANIKTNNAVLYIRTAGAAGGTFRGNNKGNPVSNRRCKVRIDYYFLVG